MKELKQRSTETQEELTKQIKAMIDKYSTEGETFLFNFLSTKVDEFLAGKDQEGLSSEDLNVVLRIINSSKGMTESIIDRMEKEDEELFLSLCKRSYELAKER